MILLMAFSIACKHGPTPTTDEPIDTETEKELIKAALRGETEAAFARDYELWKTYWVHSGDISKTYLNFAEDDFSESLGWTEIDEFVRTYIEEHPEPAPPPAEPEQMDIRLYGTGAWVSYTIQDVVFGDKRETRLMEKVDGRWKIAGLHTSIYGFKEE